MYWWIFHIFAANYLSWILQRIIIMLCKARGRHPGSMLQTPNGLRNLKIVIWGSKLIKSSKVSIVVVCNQQAKAMVIIAGFAVSFQVCFLSLMKFSQWSVWRDPILHRPQNMNSKVSLLIWPRSMSWPHPGEMFHYVLKIDVSSCWSSSCAVSPGQSISSVAFVI